MKKIFEGGTRYHVDIDDLMSVLEFLEKNPGDISFSEEVAMQLLHNSIGKELYDSGISEELAAKLLALLLSTLIAGVEIGLSEYNLTSKLVYSKN